MNDAPIWRGDFLVSGATWKHTALAVAEKHGLTLGELLGPQTARRFSRPRQEAMALVLQEHGLSTTRVGQLFGGRHHTTVLHALKAHAKDCLSTGKSNPVDSDRRAFASQCKLPAKQRIFGS